MEMYDGVITKVIHIQGKYQFFPHKEEIKLYI